MEEAKGAEPAEEFIPPEERIAEAETAAIVPERGEDLHTLGLSTRAYNALLRNNIRTVERLKKMNREELEVLDGLGAKSVNEILEIISKHAS